MAAPAYSEAIWKYVVITIDGSGIVGVVGTVPPFQIQTGYVEQVGLQVTKVSVGMTVMFKLNVLFDEGGTAQWALVHEDDIYTIISTPA